MAYGMNQISSGAGYGIGLTAGEAIAAGLLVKLATADGNVYKATATSEDLVGITISAADAAGDALTVAVAGDVVMCKVGSGGCTRGTLAMFVTGAKITDASGNVRTIGLALASGSDGDSVPVLVMPSRLGTA